MEPKNPGKKRNTILEENQNRLKIFVGGLNPFTEKGELRNFFSKFGEVKKVTVPLSKSDKKNRGFAIIEFYDLDSVNRILELDGKLNLNQAELNIRQYLSFEKSKTFLAQSQSKKLHVSGIEKGTSEKDLKKLFEKYGEVQNVMMQHKFKKGEKVFKGFVFILMKDHSSIEAIINDRNNIILHGRKLRIERALSKDDLKINKQTQKLGQKYDIFSHLKSPENYNQNSEIFNLSIDWFESYNQQKIFSNYCFKMEKNYYISNGVNLCTIVNNKIIYKNLLFDSQSVNNYSQVAKTKIDKMKNKNYAILLSAQYFDKPK